MRNSKKRSFFSSVIAILLCISLLSMGFPGVLLASVQSDQTAVTNITTDQLVPAIAENSTTDKTVAPSTSTPATSENNEKDSNKSVEFAKKNEMLNKILKAKEAEIKNHKAVNTPSAETLTDESPIDGTPVDNPTTTTTTTTDTAPLKEKKILKELVDKREANVKYFLIDDMTEEADVYSVPVHYQVNGQWKDIDNSMVSANDDTEDTSGNSRLSNKANDFKINLAKDTNSNHLIKIQKDKYEVSWNIENAEKSTAQVINDPTDKLQTTLSDEAKKKIVKNLNSKVTYPEIFKDVDLDYIINSKDLKENIILKKATDVNTFTLDLSTKNVVPQLMKDNSVVFYEFNNNKKGKDIAFIFKAPVMYDANGSTSNDISIELSKKDNHYSLTVTPNQEWLNDSNRLYPITIDPTITPSTTFDSAFVKEGSPDTTYTGTSYLEVGNNTSGQEMSYLQFNLPELSASDMVTNAKLHLWADSYTKSSRINLYRVTSQWTSSNNNQPITYNNQPSYNSIAEDYVQIHQNGQSASWDITGLTKDWYVNGNNNGILLKSPTDTTAGSGLTNFVSDTSSSPHITIQYINSSGLESYWSYHSLNVGRAGTIYSNDYNGNVLAVHDDLSLSGNRMPITLKHVYNTNNADVGYGYGWRLNYDQTVIKTTIEDATDTTIYYIYTDQDGTIHYFPRGSGVSHKDDSGLNLSLTVNTDKTYTITDKNYNTWNFNTDGKLTTITDNLLISKGIVPGHDNQTSNHANRLNIAYNEDGKIKSISDGSGRTIGLTYDNTGHLESIADLDNRITSYGYEGNKLTTITYPDETVTSYAYNEDNLAVVTNYDHHQATLGYTAGNIPRIESVEESGLDEHGQTVSGEAYTITYGNNSTSFLDTKGRTQTYQFNDSGNPTNMQNDDGSGQFFKYDTSTDALPNKLATQSKLQSSITNLMTDPSLERNNGTDWVGGIYGSNATKETATVYTSISYSHYGSKSFKLTNNDGDCGPYFDQYIELSPGKTYTFSAFVKTTKVSNGNYGAELNVYYPGSDGYHSIGSNVVNGTKDWQRVDVTFSLPSDAISNTVIVESTLRYETGTAYFDDFQLETGEICNRYNLLENGDFSSHDTSNDPTYWTKSTYCTTDDIVTTDTEQHPVKLDDQVFTMTGDAKRAKSISKKLMIRSSAGDIFVIGGWAKADSAPITKGSSRLFDIEVQFDAHSDKKTVSFNPGCKDWQYATDVIKSPGCQYITITINYSYNLNSASFDGIQLYKESYGKSYAYDDNGNLISAVDLADQKKTFVYTDNDLTGYIDAGGNNFSYGVSFSDHVINSAESAAGVRQRFTYDSNGNTTNITAGSSPSTASINTTATYTDRGNYVATIMDPLGNIISKSYDEKNGNLDSIKDAKNTSIHYQYDDLGRVINTNSTSSDSTNNTNASYTYENDRLKTITSNGVTYNFGYDPLGYNNIVTVGNQNLITNDYEHTTGNLLASTYGNGQTSSQDYDTLNRIVNQSYNQSCIIHYEYDDSGNLAYLQDIENNVDYHFIYDFANRLVLVKDSNKNSTSYTYDKNNNVSELIDTVGRNSFQATSNVPYTTSYSYDKDSRIKSVTTPTGVIVATAYDTLGLGRIASKKLNNTYSTTYSYVAGSGGSGATSKVIASIKNGADTLNYTYDANGNIQTISDGGKTINYTYDALNELIREDNQVLNKTVVYTYDKGGNILRKEQYPYTTGALETITSTIEYSYDANWKDKLSSYNGLPIEYDAIGNPSDYNGYHYTWERGKELATLEGNGLDISYKYDSNGIRMQKTVNGVTTKYHLIGDKVTFEDNETDSVYYTYDPNGNLVSMNLNETEYFYVRNAQNDVIALVDKTGATVASYVYDTWGKLVSIKDGSGNDVTTVTTSVGYKNPYRYRGYRYDTESGLYYCNSRYYSPEWGRFLNADVIAGQTGVLLSHNMFAYCINNPVNAADPTGNVFEWVQKGKQFMEQVYNQFPGFVKNTETFDTSFGNRIPDFLNSKVVGEIKNVNYQYLSSQIKGFLEIAKDTDKKKFVLVITERARLSAPLVRAIQSAGGLIIKVGKEAGEGVKMIPLFIPEKVLEKAMNPMYDQIT